MATATQSNKRKKKPTHPYTPPNRVPSDHFLVNFSSIKQTQIVPRSSVRKLTETTTTVLYNKQEIIGKILCSGTNEQCVKFWNESMATIRDISPVAPANEDIGDDDDDKDESIPSAQRPASTILSLNPYTQDNDEDEQITQ
ncbi:unnamed protein product [Didymodactylos carnosus]|uniref:Uncharacterized protein n=1 Tax=Didymodactylos carnosus TaxID=1234261 RepID=A0A815L0I1_9BILA|nr:unnamed protein product [Didymodactylos carnosus]CAF1399849.1 unnamed protein product [Didymodactylos carnosus]CAF4098670.1 unnamed protein product [Didymodactylos carnosus]CAF4293812.1 unnamed protein product [Didymodactylos carnosus]